MRKYQSVTPGRRTHVRFDVPERVLIQPGFWRQIHAKDLALGKESKKRDCVLIGEEYWQLKAIQTDLSSLHEKDNSYAGIRRPGVHYTMPSGWQEAMLHRSASDLTEATSGAVDLAATSDPFIQKEVAAGDSWSSTTYRNAGDQTAFPGTPETGTVPLDRVITSIDPDDRNGRTIVRFSIAGGSLSAKNLLMKIYFMGPIAYSVASDGTGNRGRGYWCVYLYGDGRGVLLNNCDRYEGATLAEANKWVGWAEFRWAPANQVAGRDHWISIYRYLPTFSRGSLNGFIDIFSNFSGSTPTGKPGSQQGLFARTVGELQPLLHVVCKSPIGSAPPTTEKFRVDIRRDIKPKIQVATTTFPALGYVLTDPIALANEFGLGATAEDRYFYVTWFGDTPAGTSIDVKLVRYGSAIDEASPYNPAPGTDYTVATSGTIGTAGAWKAFTVPVTEFMPTVQVQVRLSTTDPSVTPTLYGIRLTRRAVIEDTPADPIEVSGTSGALSLSIIGPDQDPTMESATFQLSDLQGAVERLKRRGFLPVEISTEYEDDSIDWSDPASEAQRSIIFDGYIESPQSRAMGTEHPTVDGLNASIGARTYNFVAQGKHLRGSMQFARQLIDFGWARDEDTATGNPQLAWKVTTALRFAFRQMGYVDDELDFPDLEIRFFPNDEEGIRVQPGTDWMSWAVDQARNYLAAVLVWDKNASASADPAEWRGMWRLITSPPLPLTKPLAYFSFSGAIGGEGTEWAPAADPAAWPLRTFFDREIPGTFIAKGSSHDIVIDAPSANCITVVGGVSDGTGRVICTAPNVNSYRAISGQPDPDPEHEDYIGFMKPLYYVDSQISSSNNELASAAIRFITARLYQSLAHAKKTLPITAPLLLVTDPDDTKQRRPRPLRIADEVVIVDRNGDTHAGLVLSCNPSIDKDSMQMAQYEILLPPGTAQDIEL